MHKQMLNNLVKSVVILAGTTGLALLFRGLGFTDPNIIMAFILGVLLTSVVTSGRMYSLISSVASVFIFNFLFTDPCMSFAVYETGYPVTFVIMFITAYVTGTLASRYKEEANISAQNEERTKILFETSQKLSKASSGDEILAVVAQQITKLLSKDTVIFAVNDGMISKPELFLSFPEKKRTYDEDKERKTVQWVLENNHFAGATTDVMNESEFLYFSLRVNERIYAIIGIDPEEKPLDVSEHSMLFSVLSEGALALENDKIAQEKEDAAILAERERMKANLLRAISHDLRSPLTSISGNASNLLSNERHFSEETRKNIYRDIYEDSMWLISLVENLLYATRIEEGGMILRSTTELLSEIVEDAITHVKGNTRKHRLSYDCEDDMILVKADARLIIQVIINIVDNAVKYTEEGSEIVIRTRSKGDYAEVQIADNGGGIPDGEKEKIFDMFYCGIQKIVDNRRSLGLGLYLCKAIIEAHGGKICVADNVPKGTVFSFTLKKEEVTLYE